MPEPAHSEQHEMDGPEFVAHLLAEIARLEAALAQAQAAQAQSEAAQAQLDAAKGRSDADNARLRAELSQVQAAFQQLEAAQAVLKQELEELRRQLQLNSRNSSKPPSSDGPAKPPAPKKDKKKKKQGRRTRSLRGRSGKRSGGQKGHKGTTLRQTDKPDHVKTHVPAQCADCGAELSEDDIEGEPQRRQVFDLPPPPPPEVTEHQAHACRCAACGSVTRAEFPQGVNAPVQYGPRIAATAVYLKVGHFLPEKRLEEVFRDLYQITICAATLAGMTKQAAATWQSFMEQVRDMLLGQEGVKHLDETGFRIAGKTQWLHVLSTRWLTFYRTSAKRGGVLAGLKGILIHDNWAPYFKIQGVLHSLCNAHHLRELEALVKLDGEVWAARMQQLLREARRAAASAREMDVPLRRSLLKRIQRRYDQIVAEALAYHRALPPLKTGRRGRKKRRPGHNLALRLRNRKEAVLRFASDLTVPFTNNQAERDLRMMKLCMKISGCFRSAQGARDFATLRGVLSTASKQGLNRLTAVLEGPDALLAKLQS